MPKGDHKHRAKRFNEGAKLLASLFNSLAIAVFGAAFVIPITQGRYDVFANGGGLLLIAGVSFHLAGQAALRFLRAED
ncbi:hypothetical protein SAMN02799631_05298 [Methylobacterium sp. 174MFSha1.1]|uniref:hypothetical protein n=1 Tax=Methylobacterium sp. 174MFSha1.1 TaxID=1502749 RepID=UPI0008F25A6F|nr:hypothetical protein [Methylobacterium sp. 174MFSha1.1]SFV11561.1 hypothetical protein SAMN02799631_05298 [Methylobacterium sp. 174MFSha1.1]